MALLDTTGLIPAADDPARFDPPKYETTQLDAGTCMPNGDMLDASGQVVRNLSQAPDPNFSEDARGRADVAFEAGREDQKVKCIDMVRLLVAALLDIDVPQQDSASSRTILGSPTSGRPVSTASGKRVDPNDTVSRLVDRLDRAGLIGESASFVPTTSTGAKLRTSDELYFKQIRTPATSFDTSPGEAILKMSGGKDGQFAYLASLVSGTHSAMIFLDVAEGKSQFTFRDQDVERRFASAAQLDSYLAEKSTWTSRFARLGGGNFPSTLAIHQLLPKPTWER